MSLALRIVFCLVIGATSCASSAANRNGARSDEDKEPETWSSQTFGGLELRTIGPALMSGRIADIAAPNDDPNTWYVGVGSGGVWKTTNAGTTWKSIFDGQGSYSIGDIAIDPSNPHTVWVGTGENVGGRHVGFGDGIYRSRDGGQSWKNLGLKASDHIGKIVIHPDDSNTLWVAAEGPLWSKGGERGVYKTTDGGKTWKNVLRVGEWTGATDLEIDPRDPNVLYAATWQRHRTVAAYVGGGPESGIYRSVDGGETWERLKKGLPEGNMGKIGLAISPMKPDILYAAIEQDQRKGGVYRSTDRGSSWERRSDTVSRATGPHYYQELEASPHVFDRLYLVDVRFQISNDGGKTFKNMSEKFKHSDNHSLNFRADDPDYLLAGTDGGIYESFDHGKTWRFHANLPVTQFYKIAVDDAEPFYTVYGGTQDNNTQGGPSRTDSVNGIRNADWFITLFADGHQPATEPGNPDIMYSEWQQGNLVRVDRTTGELVYIQPQPEADDPPERFNWDSPILVSPHDPKRLYFASQRVWRSNDRGDSWTPISGDLTRNIQRLGVPHMDRKWSWDSPWDLYAMSTFGTITSLAESPKQDSLVYAGTDDGLIQITEDGGKNWRSVAVEKLPGVPEQAFINDIKADLFDADTVYIALDNHKQGDYAPYLLKSTDRGRSWTSIVGDLPKRHLVWRVVQDHVKPNLMFAGTEFGVFFTVDGGQDWLKLGGKKAPTISFRDLAIQRRESDLVGGTFGRGIWILDDYSALRSVDSKTMTGSKAKLFSVREAHWYLPQGTLGAPDKAYQGHGYFVAQNPPFGAMFTYYLREPLRSLAKERQYREKKQIKAGEDTPFEGVDAVERERKQQKPEIILLVKNAKGETIRRVRGNTKAGMHRVAWDLRYPAPDALGPKEESYYGDEPDPVGPLAAPGDYTVTLLQKVDGKTTVLDGPVEFKVTRLREGALPGATPEQAVEFQRRVARLQRGVTGFNQATAALTKRLGYLAEALGKTPSAPDDLDQEYRTIRLEIDELFAKMNGSPSRLAVSEPMRHTVVTRLGKVAAGTLYSTYGPTKTHREQIEIAEREFNALRERLNRVLSDKLPAFEQKLRDAGGPWSPGQLVPELRP
ncbi:MAG: glycosyl hydrolase [Myxococcota bacterium]